MRSTRWGGLVMFALTLGLAAPAAAQTGTVSGKVTEALEGRPVSGATVTLVAAGGLTTSTATTGTDGGYRLNVAAGTYTLQVIALGYQSVRVAGLAVAAGASVTQNVTLEARVVQLEAVTTTVSRQAEKTTDAPAQISVVPTVEITDRPALTVIDHVKDLPGIDVSTGGLVQSNVVGRGFNNVFSGGLLMLIDNRFAAVPSLRVNVPAFFTATDQDIEKVEFVLGPGAALYGPNSANGVLAVTTKSPFDSKGTVFSLESGVRAGSQNAAGDKLDNGKPYTRFGFRHATAGKTVGFKLSGEYLQGTDWLMRDPAEPNKLTNQPGVTCNAVLGGCRDFDIEKWNLDARLDVRFSDRTQLVVNGGWSNAGNLIEYTGIGAGQAADWGYKYAQARLRSGRLFVQGFANFSDAGETFLFRDGNAIVDLSRVWAAQAQHSFDLGSRQTFTYGVDYAYTDARTGGTISGRNEANDNIEEVGGYLYSQSRLSSKIDFIAALRADKHSALEDINWSPRAAIVFKPSEDQALRFTYNRAFSTPSNNNLFLDIVAGSLPTGSKIRALGVPADGFSFRGYCGAGGVDNLCMRSPFPGANTSALPTQAALLWKAAIAAVTPALTAAGVPAQVLALLGAQQPTAAQVGTKLRRLDPTRGVFDDIAASAVTDIAPLKASTSNVFEVGYKGTFDQKVRFEGSVWFDKRQNFTGPLLVESPNVFLDPTTTGQYIQAVLAGAGIPAQQLAVLVPTLTCVLSGPKVAGCTQPGVPLATVVPGGPLTSSSDLFLTYRNFGEVSLWGADLSMTYLIDDKWSLVGAYSHVNKDFFTATEAEGPTDVALNAPKNKGALSVQYAEGMTGFAAEFRGRYVQGFPVNSGVYTTPLLTDGTRESIDSYAVMDLTASYRFKGGLLVSASVNNLLGNYYTTFANFPYLGRSAMTRITYTF